MLPHNNEVLIEVDGLVPDSLTMYIMFGASNHYADSCSWCFLGNRGELERRCSILHCRHMGRSATEKGL